MTFDPSSLVVAALHTQSAAQASLLSSTCSDIAAINANVTTGSTVVTATALDSLSQLVYATTCIQEGIFDAVVPDSSIRHIAVKVFVLATVITNLGPRVPLTITLASDATGVSGWPMSNSSVRPTHPVLLNEQHPGQALVLAALRLQEPSATGLTLYIPRF